MGKEVERKEGRKGGKGSRKEGRKGGRTPSVEFRRFERRCEPVPCAEPRRFELEGDPSTEPCPCNVMMFSDDIFCGAPLHPMRDFQELRRDIGVQNKQSEGIFRYKIDSQ